MVSNGNNGISKKREATCQNIIEALTKTHGLLSFAAKKAGVSYRTINRYANDFPSVKQAVDDAKESMTDFAEGRLFEKIDKGDTASIIFYLKTKGKSRGYIEKQEIEHSGNIGTAEELSDDELATIVESRRSRGAAKETEGS